MKSGERLIVYPALVIVLILALVGVFKPLPHRAVFRQLSIVDSEGNVKVQLSPWYGGGRIRLFGPSGNVRVKLSTTGDAGMIELFRRIGRRSVWLRANDGGGLVRVFGWEGKDGIKMVGSEKGGQLTVSNFAGEPRAKVFIDNKDLARIELLGNKVKNTKKIIPYRILSANVSQ